jgi:hypothetical protein
MRRGDDFAGTLFDGARLGRVAFDIQVAADRGRAGAGWRLALMSVRRLVSHGIPQSCTSFENGPDCSVRSRSERSRRRVWGRG